MKATKLFLIPACLLLLLASVVGLGVEPQATKYHLIKKIVVGGEGGWDALTFDSSARRLYSIAPPVAFICRTRIV